MWRTGSRLNAAAVGVVLEGLPVFGETVRVGTPLVRYEYNGSGDLVRVIGRDGKVKRSFGYKTI